MANPRPRPRPSTARPLCALTVSLLLAPVPVRATPGTWTVVPGPNGYNGQLGALYGNGKTLFAASGFTRVFSAPLAAAPQWTSLPQTGLASPYLIAALVANDADQVVLAVTNIQKQGDAGLRAWDATNMTWKAVGPTFSMPPRLAALPSGDLLASVADSIWASTDGGLTWAQRASINSQIAPPAPLPQGAQAVAAPGYLTNDVTPNYAGYSETFNVMPWGELFMGNETLGMWHSFDDGRTWEAIDPLFYVPHRDAAGVPIYANPHATTFGRGNTAGAGVTKDGEVLVNSDRNSGKNFYRYTTTGEIVPPDFAPINVPYTDGNGNKSTVHPGQAKGFCLTRSGDTLSAPIAWFAGQKVVPADGRYSTDVIGWDGRALSVVTPAAGGFQSLFGDGARCVGDGTGVFVLGTSSAPNTWRWVPQPQPNERPEVKIAGGPLTVTLDAQTGLATAAPAAAFDVKDDGKPNGILTYSWSGRGPGPIRFDAPLARATSADFRVPGDYVLTLTASDGQTSTGNGVIVHVRPAQGGPAPIITQQPGNAVLVVGQPITLALAATGPQLEYQWRRNGIELVDGPAVTGATTARLRINAATAADWDAVYDCRASNPFGRAMSHGATLGGPVAITTDPASAVVPNGTAVTFTVAADGSQPMRWQWYSVANGARTAIQGANQAAYTTAVPGTYAVDVSNAWGTAKSAPATLANGNGATFNLSVTNGGGNSTIAGGTFAGAGGMSARIALAADRFGTPGSGARFAGWTTSMGKMVTFGDASAPQTHMIVNGAPAGSTIYVVANYATAPSYALSLVNGVGSGLTRIDTFTAGSTVQIAALPPPPGAVFDHWSGNPIDGSNDPAPRFTMPAAETRLTAVYRSLNPPPDGGVPPIDMADMAQPAPMADLWTGGGMIDAMAMTPQSDLAGAPGMTAAGGCDLGGNQSPAPFASLLVAIGVVIGLARLRRRP